MKNKIILTIILLLAIFSFAKVDAKVADVSIKNVELVNKTGLTEIVNDATFSGMNINYNLIFKQVNDSVKYKVTIENRGAEDVYINNKGQIGNSNYIVYDYIWDDNQNIIKGKTEKTFELEVTYKKQVDSASYTKSSYVEDKDLVIKISDQKGNTLPVKNPNTDSNLSIFIIILSIEILAILAVTLFLIKNRKLNIRNLQNISKANKVTIGLFLIMVLSTIIGYSYALEQAEIKLNSKIKISKARLARSCYSDSFALENPYYESPGYEFISPLNDSGELTSNNVEEQYSNNFCLDWNGVIDIDYLMEYNRPSYPHALQAASEDVIMRRNQAAIDSYYYYPYVDVLTSDSKTMKEEINRNGNYYTLIGELDVSDLQNGEVILGIYQGDSSRELVFVIGQDGGVLAPVDSSWLFATGSDEYGDDAFLASEDIFDIPKDVLNQLKINTLNVMLFASEMELDKIDFSDTNNMSGMFMFNGIYTDYSYITGLKNWDTSNVKDMSGMFFVTGNHDGRGMIDGISGLDTQNVRNMQGMFTGSDLKFVNGDMNNWDVSNVKDMAGMFSGAFNDADKLNISKWNVSSVEDMTYMFANSLRTITKFDISNWNTASAISMYGMFQSSLYYVEVFDISNWNTANVEDMNGMFIDSLHSLGKLDLQNWNTSKVEDMQDMFYMSLDSAMYFNVSNWDVSNVRRFDGMFSQSLRNISKLDLSKWDMSNAIDISDMFNSAFKNTTKLDLYINNFDLSRFVNTDQYEYIFYGIPMNENVIIYVNKEEDKNWLLNLPDGYVTSGLTTNNIKLV